MSEPTLRAIPILRIFDVAKATEFYIYVRTTHLEDLHREIAAKGYRFMRPGIERTAWRSKLMEVIEPFNNRLRFDEELAPAQEDG